MKKTLTLKGVFNKIDFQNKKLEVLFPPESIDTFTKDFLTKYYHTGNSPLIQNGYIVKFTNTSIFYSDKNESFPTTMNNLLDKEISIQVELKHYNFFVGKKRISGWNLNLISMKPL